MIGLICETMRNSQSTVIEMTTDRADRDKIITKLRDRRLDLGLSITSLAGQIGCTKQLMCEWEGGKVAPGLSSLMRWARALDAGVKIVFAPEEREVWPTELD